MKHLHFAELYCLVRALVSSLQPIRMHGQVRTASHFATDIRLLNAHIPSVSAHLILFISL